MNPVKVSLDAKKRTVKPNDRDIKTISGTIHKNPVKIPLDTLADCAGNKGFTFAPAIFNGNRRAANVSEIQLICLDFDNKDLKISFDEALYRSEKLDLPIAFAYETFSSINRGKFRIVYRYFEPIVNQNFYKIIINILFELFPEADRAASDWSRIFFGGKKLLTDVNLKTIHPQRLFSSLYQYYSENTKTKVKNIEKFALSNNIELINNTFHTDIINIKTGTTLDEPVIYNKDNSNLFPDETFIIYQNNSKSLSKNF